MQRLTRSNATQRQQPGLLPSWLPPPSNSSSESPKAMAPNRTKREQKGLKVTLVPSISVTSPELIMRVSTLIWPRHTLTITRQADAPGYFRFACLHHKAEPFHDEACQAYKAAQIRLTHSYVLAEYVALGHARCLPRPKVLSFIADLVADPDIE